MAKYCLRACGRLSTAAILIVIAIIQVIAGLILMRSKYANLLSVPNFWTACGNIAVGSLFGISATVWKTIHKKSSKYAARRGFLASLAISVLFLNATTAAIFIIDESKTLLSIYLDERITNSTISAKEIFAYAYATSVCSPIVCVVISIAFLIGICCQSKTVRKKTVDLKNNLDEGNTQIYSWVYTPKLPKPDPEVLTRAAMSSSGSETSSSESDSDSSLDIPIPYSPNISSEAYQNPRLEISNQSLLLNSEGRRECTNSVRSNNSKAGRVSFADESISERIVRDEDFLNRSSRNVVNYQTRASPVACTNSEENALSMRFPKSRDSSKILFTEYPSGDSIHSSINSSKHARISEPNHYEEEIIQPLDLSQNMHSLSDEVIRELNNLHTSPKESQFVHEDAELPSPDSSLLNTSNPLLVHHDQVQRTSTADHSKVQQELQSLEDSAIYFEPEVRNHQEDITLPSLENMEVSSYERSIAMNKSDAQRLYSPAKEVIKSSIRHSKYGKRLPSKLIPVSTPVISDGNRYIVPSRQISPSPEGVKPYSKTKNSYNKYLLTGFSTFKVGRKSDEVDAINFPKKQNSITQTSPMASISEDPTEDANDSMLVRPSTSTHTSGYMSASYDDSDDESDSILWSKEKKSQSVKIAKSKWTDVPLDDDRCTSFQSETASSSFDQTSAVNIRNSSKKIPSRSGKVSQNQGISII